MVQASDGNWIIKKGDEREGGERGDKRGESED